MAVWKIEPTYKKSIVERTYWHKDDRTIIIETGWRWGAFTCETEDDSPPEITAGTDLFNCDYDVELDYCDDGCWEQHEFEGFEPEDEELMEEFLTENSMFELEEDGWTCGDTEMIMDCDPAFEMLEPTGEKKEEPVDVSKPKWPFPG